LRSSAVWLQMAIFFLYTGLEVTFSQWTFTVLTESRHVSPRTAGIAVGCYWGCIGAGRILSGLIVERVGIDRLVRYCLLGAGSGALLFATRPTVGAEFLGLAVAGLGLAPVFPCLMSRTPRRLGTQLSAHAIGFQVAAAMIGAAVVPGTLGVMASVGGLEIVPVGTAVLFGILALLYERLMRRPDAGLAPN
jgi:fucose permease